MEYVVPEIDSTNEELEASMLADYEAHNLQSDRLKQTVHLCASLIELGYHDLDLDEKKNIAILNWYMVYVDDLASKNTGPIREFEMRFLRKQPQLDPVLDALVDALLRLWDQYEMLVANSILESMFEFISSSCVEQKVETLPLSRDAKRFPWFLRERTGIGAGYAFLMFTKARNVDIMEYIQAMPDMANWSVLSNDLLSFYKEALAGDKSNYVSTRAFAENKPTELVLSEIANECITSQNTIRAVLSNNPDALKAWKIYERGSVTWHLTQSRYRLQDLGLFEN